MGDVFDFWFDYKKAVPKGFVRLLGKIASFTDAGIPVYWFTGNHDLWMFGYVEEELGVQLLKKPVVHHIDGKRFYLAHGDGLGPGDYGYKFIKRVFTNPLCQWAFRWIHPDVGIGMANFFSRKSRQSTGDADSIFLGEDQEWLIIHSKEVESNKHHDFYIYGHRHYPKVLPIGASHYINLGDWINYFTYGVFHEGKFCLYKFHDAGKSEEVYCT